MVDREKIFCLPQTFSFDFVIRAGEAGRLCPHGRAK